MTADMTLPPPSAASRWLGYGAAVIVVAFAAGVRWVILPLDGSVAFLTFYPAVAIVFYAYGAGPGRLAVALAAVIGYYLAPPVHSWEPSDVGLWATAVFVVFAVIVGSLIGRLRLAADQARAGELALREARDALHDQVENAPVAYYSLDVHGRFLSLNEKALEWFGCTRREAIGQLGSSSFMTEEGQASFRDYYPRLISTGSIGPIELDIRSRGGRLRRVSLFATAVRDEAGQFVRSRSVMVDVGELHAAREELARVGAEQAAMLDNDLLGIVKLKGGEATWVNRGVDRLYGRDGAAAEPDAAFGRLFLSPADRARRLDEVGAMLAAGHRYRGQWRLRHHDGTPLWIDASGVSLPGRGRESLLLLADITPLKEAEDARLAAATELRA